MRPLCRISSAGLLLLSLVSAGCATSHGASSHDAAVAHAPASDAPGLAPTPDPLAGWEKIRDEDGIVVHRKEIEGSPLVAFRGEGIVAAPIAEVALVQMDLAHTPEWIERLKDARVLEVTSDTRFVTYSHLGAPILVSDRDFVNEVNIEYSPPSKIVFHIHGVESDKAPSKGNVRGVLMHSRFELTAVEGGSTRVVCEIHADPKGLLPKSVVNLFQRGWAYKTLTHMREQVKRPDVVERAPEIKALLERNGFRF